MPKTRLLSNADAIVQQTVEMGLTATEVAKAIGARGDFFSRMTRCDTPISYATAKKLRHFFGSCAVKIIPQISANKNADEQ